MSNNKFHKILSDTITLPLLPASNFKETNTGYYAVLEKIIYLLHLRLNVYINLIGLQDINL